MWYAFQIVSVFGLAVLWTRAPGNTPDDFGRGLFLGALCAWWLTWVLTLLFDAIRRVYAKLFGRVALGRRSHQGPDQIVSSGDRVGTRPPRLISKV